MMYNRYIPESRREQPEQSAQSNSRQGRGNFDPGRNLFSQLGLSFGAATKNAGIAGIFKELGLEELDSGDILLLLILLLIFLEGDNMELVITLGLMLLLGGEKDQKE